MGDYLSDAFRANVRTAMRLQGLTYEALAERLGVHPVQVGKQLLVLRNGRPQGYRLSTVEKYAAALGVDPVALLRKPS